MADQKETLTGVPGPEDLELIGRYTRRPLGAEEVYVFPVVLCDNEVDRDGERFAIPALEQLAALFVGKTGIFDHDPKGRNQTARLYRCRVERDDSRLTAAGEPYHALRADAYMLRGEATSQLIREIDGGIKKEVSVGCAMASATCSVCGADRRKDPCRHRPGERYEGKLCHTVLDDPADAYECSFVAVPAQRGAGVVKSHGARGVSVEKLLQCPPGEDVLLTKGQVKEIGRRFQELAERARWGGQYRRELERNVLKYSALVQPDMPRAVMEAALKGLDMEALAQMEKTYERMAQRSLPLKPQLAAERPEQHARNSEFQI